MEKLQIIEKENQRVLTTAVLAQEYETTTQIIINNFNRNKERYINGKHYYCLEGEELKDFKTTTQIDLSLNKVNKLYLWTERGALLHAKSLNTDRAWEVYDILVETYFKKQVTATNTSINDLEKTKLEIQKTRAEAMALNAKNRAFNTLMKSIEKHQNLSPIAVQVFGLKGLEGIFGVDVGNYLPEVEKTYSAKEVGKMLGISANKVGRIANANGLKTPEYGRYVADKSKNSDKEVENFRYNENGVKVLQELAW